MTDEIADIYNEEKRTARLYHKCISGCRIRPGETYYCIKVLFDGHWTTYKVHPLFYEWLQYINKDLDWHETFTYEDWQEADLSDEDLYKLRSVYVRGHAPQYKIDQVSHALAERRYLRRISELESRLEELKTQLNP